MAKVKATATKVRAKPDRGGPVKAKVNPLDDPNALTAPLTPRSLNKQTSAAVRLRYGGQERDLQGQLRASDQQAANSANWFADYRKAVDASTARQQQINQDAQTALVSEANTASSTDAANRQQVGARAQAGAASRGATVDPGLATAGVQAEASRRQGLDTNLGAITRTGAANASYMADQGRIAAERGVVSQQNIASQKQKVRVARNDLKGQEGDYATQYKANAITAERNQQNTLAALTGKAAALNQQITHQNRQDSLASQRLGLDLSRLNLSAQHQQALEAIARKNANTSASNAQTKRQQNNYLRQHGLGPFKPAAGAKVKTLSANQQNQQINAVGEARTWITRLGQSKHMTSTDIRALLSTGSTLTDANGNKVKIPKIGHDLVNAAYDLVTHGHLSGPNIAALKRAGVRIPRAWLP